MKAKVIGLSNQADTTPVPSATPQPNDASKDKRESGMQLLHASPSSTAVYSYSFKPDAACREAISRQFFMASQLYNEIIATIRNILSDAQKDLLDCAGPAALELSTRLGALNEDSRLMRVAHDQEGLRRINAERRLAWSKLQALLSKARSENRDRLRVQYYSKIGSNSRTLTYGVATRAIEAGLGSDTAMATLGAALKSYSDSLDNGSLPRFKRAFDTLQWTLTIAAHRGGGIPVDEVASGKWLPCQLGVPREKGETRVRYRLGRANLNQYATGTIRMHRSLPSSGSVAEVLLKARRVGHQMRYWIDLVMVQIPQMHESAANGVCGLYFTCSKTDKGHQVATLATGTSVVDTTPIFLPESVNAALDNAQRADYLRSTLFNEMWPKIKLAIRALRPSIEARLQERVDKLISLPTANVSHFELHSVLDELQKANPGQIPAFVMEWFKWDRQFLMRSSAGRRRAFGQRQHHYRTLAAHYARIYQTLVMPKLDLREAGNFPMNANEMNAEVGKRIRGDLVRASVGELRASFVNAFRSRGGVIVECSDSLIDKCAGCGHVGMVVDTENSLPQSCPNCHRHFVSSTANAAANLVAMALETPGLVMTMREEDRRKTTSALQAKAAKLQKMQEARHRKPLQAENIRESVLVTH